MPKTYKKTNCGKNPTWTPYQCFRKGIGVGLYVLAPKKAKEEEEKKKKGKVLKKWKKITKKLIKSKKKLTLSDLKNKTVAQLVAIAKSKKIPYTKKSGKGYRSKTVRLKKDELIRAIFGQKPKAQKDKKKPKLKVKFAWE